MQSRDAKPVARAARRLLRSAQQAVDQRWAVGARRCQPAHSTAAHHASSGCRGSSWARNQDWSARARAACICDSGTALERSEARRRQADHGDRPELHPLRLGSQGICCQSSWLGGGSSRGGGAAALAAGGAAGGSRLSGSQELGCLLYHHSCRAGARRCGNTVITVLVGRAPGCSNSTA